MTDTKERANKVFAEQQVMYESMIMRKAESDILISRLQRETSDLDIRIKTIKKVLEEHGHQCSEACSPTPSANQGSKKDGI